METDLLMISSKNIIFKQRNKVFKTYRYSRKEVFKRILFPFYPINIFKHNSLILILAAMISLSIVLGYVKIKIPNVGISLAFGWIPTIICGWFFGPIIGIFLAIIIDTINYVLHPGVWFWMYFIQEPMVGLISGIFGSCVALFKNRTTNFMFGYFFSQLIINLFFIFTLTIIIVQFNIDFNLINILFNKDQLGEVQPKILFILIISLLCLFFIVMQVILNYKFIKNKKNIKTTNNNLFYIASLAMVLTFIFSFLLGPISAIEFFKYINNKPPSSLIKYGKYYYLLPRIIKEIFKTPIYILLLNSLILCIGFQINKTKNYILNKW